MTPKLIRTFLLCCLLCATLPGTAPAARGVDPELEHIRSKLAVLNLLNGLELTPEQMRLVVEVARQAVSVRAERSEALKAKETELLEVGRELLRNAESGSLLVPEEIKERWHAVNKGLEEAKAQTLEKLGELASRVRAGLEPHQLIALDGYKACVIPPVQTGHIGQADDADRFAKLLDRARAIPRDRYQSRKRVLARKAVDKAKSKAPAGFIMDRAELEGAVLKVVDEARALTDVQFALRKEELAKKLKSRLMPDRPPQNIGVKIERFLLSDEIVPILESRLAALPKD